MSRPKVLVLRTAGTNCDEETVHAWTLAGADPKRRHVRELMQAPAQLHEYSILTFPGGFSYGDDISAGKILAVQVTHFLADALREFVGRGRLVIGICNGFQVLVKAGLLPGPANGEKPSQTVTLAGNDSARFEDRWVHLKTGERETPFLPADRILSMPIAHGEGKLVTRDAAELERLRSGGHVAVTYCDEHGEPGGYPVNPNGSVAEIAGLTDRTGHVFGLMPHPERHVHATQHPNWTSRGDDAGNALVVFERAVRFAAG